MTGANFVCFSFISGCGFENARMLSSILEYLALRFRELGQLASVFVDLQAQE